MNIKKPFATIAIFALFVVALVGCTPSQATDRPSVEPSIAQPAEPTEEPTAEAVNPLIKPLGDVVTYTDGTSISVSTPVDFVPTEYANGADQAHQVLFTIVLTNGTDKPLDPLVYPTVSSGGVESDPIIDIGNPAGQTSFGPETTILPGQTVEWLQAFSIADPANITVELSPSFEYQSAIFTNIPL